VQAIALAACHMHEWTPLLVVCPASIRLLWCEELEKWLPSLRPCDITVVQGNADWGTEGRLAERAPSAADAAPAAPDGSAADATGTPDAEAEPRCGAEAEERFVIVDESHHLRTAAGRKDTAQTEAVRRLVRGARRAVLLTGTPSVTRPFDLAGQLHSLAPQRLHGMDAFDEFKTAFAWRYCQRRLVAQRRGRDAKRWAQSGAERLRELAGVLRRDFMVRRLKLDVLPQLPAKRRQVVRLERPSAQDYNLADSVAFQVCSRCLRALHGAQATHPAPSTDLSTVVAGLCCNSVAAPGASSGYHRG